MDNGYYESKHFMARSAGKTLDSVQFSSVSRKQNRPFLNLILAMCAVSFCIGTFLQCADWWAVNEGLFSPDLTRRTENEIFVLQLIVSPQSGTSTQTDFSLWSCDKPSGCSITVLDADNCNGGLPQPLHLNFTWPPAAGTFEITFTQPYFLAGCTYLVCAFLWITSVLILYSDMKQFLIKSRRYLSRWKIQRPVKLVFILKSTWNYSILTCWSPRLSRSGFPCRCLNSDKFLDFQHSTAELDGLLFAVDQPSLYQHRISQVLAWYIMWLG